MVDISIERIIHEKLSVILTFAFSRHAVANYRRRFVGRWRYAEYVLSEYPEQEASKAAIEMGLYLRTLDDRQNIAQEFQGDSFGTLTKKDGSIVPMNLRDVANKIIHSKSLEWAFTDPEEPKIICHGDPSEGWVAAEINLTMVTGALSLLMDRQSFLPQSD